MRTCSAIGALCEDDQGRTVLEALGIITLLAEAFPSPATQRPCFDSIEGGRGYPTILLRKQCSILQWHNHCNPTLAWRPDGV